jgi:uncharacterized protein YbcI
MNRRAALSTSVLVVEQLGNAPCEIVNAGRFLVNRLAPLYGFAPMSPYLMLRQAVIKFEQDFMGRGPTDVRALIVRDMVVVRLKGVLTQAERQLAKHADGIEMVKRIRQNLMAQGKDRLCSEIAAITGVKVTGLFTDIDTQVDERIMVFTLDQDLGAIQPSNRSF